MVSRDRLDLPQEQRDQRRQTRRNAVAANTGFMSVTRGTFRVASPEGFRVQGSQLIDGTTVATGDFTIDGPWHIAGNGDITGNVTVTGGGTITVQGSVSMTIGALSDGRAGISFGSARLSSNGGGVALESGGYAVGARPDGALMLGSGGTVGVGSAGPFMTGLPTTTNPPNVYIASNGLIYRSTATGTTNA